MARGQKTRVLLASACRAQREAWRRAIELQEEIEVVGDAATAPRLVSLLAVSPIEILLLEAALGTIEVLQEVHAQSPETKTLIIGSSLAEAYISRALCLGGRGFLNASDPTDYAKAIRVVAAGDLWVARNTLVQLLRDVLQGPTQSHAPCASDPLTAREQQIVACIARGMTNKEIGKHLGVSDRTIKAHLRHVFKKLKISRRIQLLLLDRVSPEKG